MLAKSKLQKSRSLFRVSFGKQKPWRKDRDEKIRVTVQVVGFKVQGWLPYLNNYRESQFGRVVTYSTTLLIPYTWTFTIFKMFKSHRSLTVNREPRNFEPEQLQIR